MLVAALRAVFCKHGSSSQGYDIAYSYMHTIHILKTHTNCNQLVDSRPGIHNGMQKAVGRNCTVLYGPLESDYQFQWYW